MVQYSGNWHDVYIGSRVLYICLDEHFARYIFFFFVDGKSTCDFSHCLLENSHKWEVIIVSIDTLAISFHLGTADKRDTLRHSEIIL